MPTYRTLNFPAHGSLPEAPSPLAIPGKPTQLSIAHAAMHALDSLQGSGYRTVYAFGLDGGDRFLCPNGLDPTVSRIYPDKDTARIVGRGNLLDLSPGCFLGLDMMALPSGLTQDGLDLVIPYTSTGAEGRYVLTVDYTNGTDTITGTATLVIPGSVYPWGAEPADAFGELFFAEVVANPLAMVPTLAHLEKYMRGNRVRASWILRAYGSPRPVDAKVVEYPVGITVDLANTRWPSAMYTSPGGDTYNDAPSEYPIEQLTTADPAGGVGAVLRAIVEQGRQLGPVLCWWHSSQDHQTVIEDWISYDTGTGDDEVPPLVGGGTTQVHVPFGAAHNDAFPGWLMGHYAAQVENGPVFMDGRTTTIPVWVSIYAKSADARFTFITGPNDGWSAIRVDVTGDVWGWYNVPGDLEVGTGAEDALLGRLYAESITNVAWRIRYMCVFFRQPV